VISSGYLNLGPESWSYPAVGNLNAYNTFFVAAEVKGSGYGKNIKGRALPATAPPLSPGGPVYVLSPQAKTKLEPTIYSRQPAVGGDPSTDPAHARFCVAWQQGIGSANTYVVCRFVDPLGAPAGSAIGLSPAGPDAEEPGISASNDGTEWTVVFTTRTEPPEGYYVYRLMLARIGWNGALTLPAQEMFQTIHGLNYPKVSSSLGGRQLVCFWQHPNVEMELLEIAGTTVLDHVIFAPYGAPNSMPDIVTEDDRFVLTFSGAPVVGPSYTQLLSVLIDPGTDLLDLAEHMLLQSATADACGASRFESGGVPGRLLEAWAAAGAGGGDIKGAFYPAE